mmetsp:Transcript_21383/g.60570  ORF Transcript_21383/g.60570 Transcript_21383/m.60570 type:complete len:118 (+) Transcript_21383:808-1161(+)
MMCACKASEHGSEQIFRLKVHRRVVFKAHISVPAWPGGEERRGRATEVLASFPAAALQAEWPCRALPPVGARLSISLQRPTFPPEQLAGGPCGRVAFSWLCRLPQERSSSTVFKPPR